MVFLQVDFMEPYHEEGFTISVDSIIDIYQFIYYNVCFAVSKETSEFQNTISNSRQNRTLPKSH